MSLLFIFGIGFLLVLLMGGWSRIFMRLFTQPQHVPLATLIRNPESYRDQFVETQGRFMGGILQCPEGRMIGPPVSWGIGTQSAPYRDINIDGVYPAEVDVYQSESVVIQGWLRRYEGQIGCDYTAVGGPNQAAMDPTVHTIWYIEAATVRFLDSNGQPLATGTLLPPHSSSSPGRPAKF